MAQSFTKNHPLDTDVLLSGNSDYIAASQRATKAYLDNRLSAANALDLQDGGETALHTHASSGGNFVLIADSGILGASAANIDFTSIPATYKHLQLVMSLRSDNAAVTDIPIIRFNNDSAANYDWMRTNANAAATTLTEALAQAQIACVTTCGNTAVANDFGKQVVDISDYANANVNKNMTARGGYRTTAAANGIFVGSIYGHWRSAAAISRITIIPFVGANWKQYSRIVLYGYN